MRLADSAGDGTAIGAVRRRRAERHDASRSSPPASEGRVALDAARTFIVVSDGLTAEGASTVERRLERRVDALVPVVTAYSAARPSRAGVRVWHPAVRAIQTRKPLGR